VIQVLVLKQTIFTYFMVCTVCILILLTRLRCINSYNAVITVRLIQVIYVMDSNIRTLITNARENNSKFLEVGLLQ